MREVSSQASKKFHPVIFDGWSKTYQMWSRSGGICRLCRALCADELCPGCLRDLPRPSQQKSMLANCEVRAAYRYAGVIPGLVALGKYGGHLGVCRLLGQLMLREFSAGSPTEGALIVPVPMPWPRLLWRGYNHAAVMASVLGAGWRLPVHSAALVRRGWQPTQKGRRRQARLQNLRGGFRVASPIENREVWLVDDVCTTGATLIAASQALLDGGARRVLAWVLARREWSRTPPGMG